MWYIGGYKIGVLNYNQVWYTCGSSLQNPTVTCTRVPVQTITPIPTATRTRTPIIAETATVIAIPTNTITPQPVVVLPTPEPVPTVKDGDSTCYPTTAKDNLKIVFNIVKKADVKIYIYDISGKLVKTTDIKTGDTPHDKLYKVMVDVRGFESGVYYYVIQGKTESGELINFKSKKFIVKGMK
jgi:hypothetical protein